MNNAEPNPAPPTTRSRETANPPVRLDSRTLLGDCGEVVIEHAGREYRLRVTQNGKLILTA